MNVQDEKYFDPDYILIPYPLYKCRELSQFDCFVYGLVYWFHSMRDGMCYASNERIASIINCSPRAIQNSINKLIKAKFLERKMGKNGQNRELLPLVTFRSKTQNSLFVRNEVGFTPPRRPVHPINISNKDKIQLAADAAPAPWVLEEKLSDMEKVPNSALDIIATFIRSKGIVVENAKQLSVIIGRYMRAAQKISGAYTNEQIEDAIEEIERQNKRRATKGDEVDWTIETILKMLTK